MKGKIGLIKCRLASPQALMEVTKPTQIILTINKNGPSNNLFVKPIKLIQSRNWNYNLGNYKSPLNYIDSRVIAWELERKTSDFSKFDYILDMKGNNVSQLLKFDLKENINGRIVSFSPTLTNLLSCNTALYLLGSGEQAKAICYYMFDYLLKDIVQKVNTLSAGLAAINKLKDRKKEINEGTKEPQDELKYFFNVFLNQVNNSMEFSATMASSLLLGLSSIKISHEFWLVHITSATNLVLDNYNKKLLVEELKHNNINLKSPNIIDTSNTILSIDTNPEELLLDNKNKNKRKFKLSSLRNNYKMIYSNNLLNQNKDKMKVDDSDSKSPYDNQKQQHQLFSSNQHLSDKLTFTSLENHKDKSILSSVNFPDDLQQQQQSPSLQQLDKSLFTKITNNIKKTPTFVAEIILAKTPKLMVNAKNKLLSTFKSPNATTKKKSDYNNDINNEIDEDIRVYVDNDNNSVEDNLYDFEDSVSSSFSDVSIVNIDINKDSKSYLNNDPNIESNLFPVEENFDNEENNFFDIEEVIIPKEENIIFDDDLENFFEGVLDEVNHVSSRDKSISGSKQSASIHFTTDKDGKLNVTLSDQASNYSYRGKHLSDVCLYLYVGIIVIVPIGDLEYIDPDTVTTQKVINEIDVLFNDLDNDDNVSSSDSDNVSVNDYEEEELDEATLEGLSQDIIIEENKRNEELDEDIEEKNSRDGEQELKVEDEKVSNKKKSGRFKNKHFFFANDCPYKNSFIQVIRSKFRIPLIPCYKPRYPNFIDDKPINSKLSDEQYFSEKMIEADKYGIFMLTLFKPWNIVSKCPNGDLNWFGFCDYVSFLCKRYDIVSDTDILIQPHFTDDSDYYRTYGDDSIENQNYMKVIIHNPKKKRLPFNRVIYQWIENMTTGLNPKKSSKKMLMMWRNRAVKTWEDLKIINKLSKANRAKLTVNSLHYEKNDDFDEDDLDDAYMNNLFSKMVEQICNQGNNLTYSKDKANNLEKGEITDSTNREYLKNNLDMLKNVFNISDGLDFNNHNINIVFDNIESIPRITNVFVVNCIESYNNLINHTIDSSLETIIKNYKNKSIIHNVKISYSTISALEVQNSKYSLNEKNEIMKWYDMMDKIESNTLYNMKDISIFKPHCLGKLNKTQQKVLDLFIINWDIRLYENDFKKSKKRKTLNNNHLMNFIHGGPGTGKTFLITSCLETLEIMNYQKFLHFRDLLSKSDASKVYATTGIASALYIVYNGSTIFSGFDIKIEKKKKRRIGINSNQDIDGT